MKFAVLALLGLVSAIEVREQQASQMQQHAALFGQVDALTTIKTKSQAKIDGSSSEVESSDSDDSSSDSKSSDDEDALA